MPSGTKDDAAIRDRILAELERLPWKALGLNVVVRNGNVELSGIILDERERQALKVAAENVPGVKALHDHLTWVIALVLIVVVLALVLGTAAIWIGLR